MFRILAAAFGVAFLAACAHLNLTGPGSNALSTLDRVCALGAGTGSMDGAVWLKAHSKDASGQFPADVKVESSGKVLMEVTNLIGETQARIEVDSGSYHIMVPGKDARDEKGDGSWGGIPLRWAPRLFLGRFPCPDLPLDSSATAKLDVDDHLEVHVGNEDYLYVLSAWGGGPWVSELTWLRKNAQGESRVLFKFDRPDESSGAPLRWSAVSDQGSVDVRWRRRKPGTNG
ncbi:MAG TPA: hypothetical protein VL588_03810 [Bdellovibrionota bacterium]|jgi:hypothetical protein|nr:hypothetical protein [Bdellovibrionota bacterium]